MRQEAARLTFLVQDLITLNRIQTARPVPDPRPVGIDAVVAEALDYCRVKADARGITLISAGTRGLSALGSEELLVTAVRNLLENAVAYSPGGAEIVARATGGTGLGLAIVKHIMAAHGGRASVRSAEGEGSTFTLWIPLRQEAVR
jgi:two-component system sensor histidine kinase SenX3